MTTEKISSSKTVQICEKISKAALYLAVFLTPLFFLFLTVDPIDFNKSFLLGILVLVAFFAWLVRILILGTLQLNLARVQLPILVLLLVYGLSTIFSKWPSGSFWGWPLDINAGFLNLLILALFYFLVINVFSEKKDAFRLLFLAASSLFFAALFGVLQLFGKFFLPWDLTQNASFNTVGTVNGLAVLLAGFFSIALVLALVSKRISKFLTIVFAAAVLITLVVINFWIAWLVLIAATAVLFLFGIMNIKGTGQATLVSLPMVLLIVALFFLTFKIPLPGMPGGPIEISLSYGAEFNILKATFKELGLVKSLLGTGPGTFVYNYSKFKPVDLNQTIFWSVRFGNGASDVFDRLITTGILGLLAWLSVVGLFFKYVFQHLREGLGLSEKKEEWMMVMGIFGGIAGIVMGQFIYPASFSLLFMFWLGLAVVGVVDRSRVQSWTIEPSSYTMVIVSGMAILAIIFGVGISFVGVQKYAAEMEYYSGLKAFQEGQVDPAITSVLAAVRLNPGSEVYWRDLAQLYITKLTQILQDTTIPAEESRNQAAGLASNAVDSAKKTTEINPQNVVNWSVRGFVYQNIIGLVSGSETWALENYERAITLEPTNPYLFTELGWTYVLQSDIFAQAGKDKERQEALDKALEKFNKAIELKQDYALANFRAALVYDRLGEIDQAIDKMEQAKMQAPFDTGIGFRLGLLYYRKDELSKAKAELEGVIILSPNHSNARYFLGLIYDREGKKDLAIEQFEKVQEFNPQNEEVSKILENLRAGKPALEGITTGEGEQPAIEEQPQEILQ